MVASPEPPWQMPVAELARRVATILHEEDPARRGRDGAYDAEAPGIVARLDACTSPQDVSAVLHDEVARRSGAGGAGVDERYGQAAARIWRRWAATRAWCRPTSATGRVWPGGAIG